MRAQAHGTTCLSCSHAACRLPCSCPQRRKRQLKAREAGKVEAAHVSAGGAVLGLIAGAGQAAAMTKVTKGWNLVWAGSGLLA